MTRLASPLLAVVALAAIAVPAFAQGEGSGQEAAPPIQVNPFKPFDRAQFEAEAKALGATAEQLEAFGANIDEYGLATAADMLVRAAVPEFDAAVKLHEATDPSAALAFTKVLAGATQPLLRAHVRYHLGEVFLDSDDPESAIEVLGDYIHEDINHSPLDSEAAFYYPQALAEMPYPSLAIPRFKAFLQWFPAASERFRSAAHQQILELERQQDSQLHDLADRMKKTRRDLKKKRTTKPVQIEQEKYVEELQQLIEMFEEMERQAGGPPSGNGPSSNPATQSALPEGDGSVGQLNPRPSLADRWGDMKDHDREKIEAEVQNSLPPQYRKMLEQYYKKLGTSSGRR
ncbi:MAG: hypothetical protein KDE27_17815 [Planctomycetes bacterium]|nr:hypothetical protein [Planctomycetota bacterium]